MNRILLSAFEPFKGAAVNGSEQVLRRLMERPEWRERLHPVVLPVVRGKAEEQLIAALDHLDGRPESSPRRIVSLGEAGPEPIVSMEFVALNFDHFRIPDNGGNQPCYSTIDPDGPAAYFSTIPLQSVLDTLQGRTPLPVRLSLSAGAFVCNHLYYTVMRQMRERADRRGFVFVHVPAWRPETELLLPLEPILDTVAALLDQLVATEPLPAPEQA